MKKDDILKILDFASFVLIIIATILVILFEFLGGYGFMKSAIVLYFVGFLLLSAFLSARVYFAFAKKKPTEEAVTGEEKLASTELVETKKQKGMLIAMLVISIIVLIFTLVVMILY